MESTRERRLAVVVGLWMLASSPAAAQENPSVGSEDRSGRPTQPAVPGSLTANSGLQVGVEAATPATVPRRTGPERSVLRSVSWYRSPYLALAVVLALIVGVGALFKRYVPGVRSLAGGAFRVVGRMALSPKQTAVLLHVGKRLVLIGVGSDRVQTLAEITDQEEVSFVLGQAAGPERLSGDAFRSTLAREFEQYEAPWPDSSASVDEPADGDRTLQQTKGRLQRLLGKLRALQSAA